MNIDLYRIRSVVKQLQEIANELKITISISAYGNLTNYRPFVFLHDNTGADTDSYNDVMIMHSTGDIGEEEQV